MTATTPIDDAEERAAIQREGVGMLDALLEAAQRGLDANASDFLRFAGVAVGAFRTIELQTLGERDRFEKNRCAHPTSIATALRLLREAEQRACEGVYFVANEPIDTVCTRGPRDAWRTMHERESTSDADIVRRWVLFIDVDFERPTKTSASDDEVRRVFEVAERIEARFRRSVPAASIGCGHSGNGAALFVALDGLAETPELAATIKGILEASHRQWSDPRYVANRKTRGVVAVDTVVAEAKRLCPAFGTTKRKGSAHEVERPHRATAFLAPASVVRVDAGALDRLLADLVADLDDAGRVAVDKAMGRKAHRPAPAPATKSETMPPKSRTRPADGVDPFAAAKALDMREVLEWLGLIEGDQPVCPGCNLSDSGVAVVGTGLKCSHARCGDKGFANGYRTTVDVVAEAKNVEPIEAVRLLGDRFGFEVPKAKRQPKEPPARDREAEDEADFERGDHVELATRLLARLGDREDLVGEESLVHRYNAPHGLFVVVERGEQSRIVQAFAGVPCGDRGNPLDVSSGDVGGAIRLAYDQVERPKFFAGAPDGLAFRNGFVRVTSAGLELRPHARENRARAGYDFDFSASVEPVQWLCFLREVFEGDEDAETRIAFLLEWLGASMLGIATKWELCLVLIGTGANGKSVVIQIAKAIMPAGTTQAIAPQLWGQEYRRAKLQGCRLNVVAELPTGDILASDSFKAIVTGDSIDARAIREAPFTLRPIAGHLFAANQLPGTRDLSEGFWRRMVVLRFGRHFPKAVADVELAGRIVREETPAIVGACLAAAARLMARGRFVVPSSSQAEVDAWKAKADAVSAFVAERCADVKHAEERETAGGFYERFKLWASNQGFVVPSSRTVGERMAALGKGSVKGAHGARFYPLRVLRLDELKDDEGQPVGSSWN